MFKQSIFKQWFRGWTINDWINHILLSIAAVLLVYLFVFQG